jgi:hypothetical protein
MYHLFADGIGKRSGSRAGVVEINPESLKVFDALVRRDCIRNSFNVVSRRKYFEALLGV